MILFHKYNLWFNSALHFGEKLKVSKIVSALGKS